MELLNLLEEKHDNNRLQKYGSLLTPDIKLHRQWFREMVKLWGTYVLYRCPYPGKGWTTYGELDSNFNPPIQVGCIIHDNIDQKSAKKMGWISELTENSILVDLDYDLPNLQIGCLIIIPSGVDEADGRLFVIRSMKNSMTYPCCVTCELVPEFVDSFNKGALLDFTAQNHSTINIDESNDFVLYQR